jgi:pyruvate kinase
LSNLNNSRNKIVATIGPGTANKNILKKMYKAGMSVARLNGSHNNLDWHSNSIKLIKNVLPSVPILLDIPGKKIRTGQLKHEPSFKISQEIILSSEKGHDGTKKVSITNKDLYKFLSKGDTIFADDGTLKFKVSKIEGKDIFCKAQTNGTLKSSKGINVPFVNIGKKLITERDKVMIKFAIDNQVNFVGISFVESANHINKIRDLLKSSDIKIVAKVENRKGLENLEEIVLATDIVMIDRGDLSTETDIESLAFNQKTIISRCNFNSKPVIVATEMMDSMIESPYPTKAEVLDIANSILDGATATMLSGETAIGKYPVESIKIMANIAFYASQSKDLKLQNNIEKPYNAMGKAISSICISTSITKIVAITISGFAARIIASQSLKQPIIAVTNNEKVAKSFNIFSNTKGVYINTKFHKNNVDHIPKCLFHLWKEKLINTSDNILVVSLSYPGSGKRMNSIETHNVKDLKNIFSWK